MGTLAPVSHIPNMKEYSLLLRLPAEPRDDWCPCTGSAITAMGQLAPYPSGLRKMLTHRVVHVKLSAPDIVTT